MSETSNVSTLFYTPARHDALWDSSLYRHEGMYYLLYLAGGPNWDWHSTGLATSPDGITWTEQEDAYDSPVNGGVMRIADRDGSPRFLMYIPSTDYRTRRSLQFLESTDLRHWSRIDERHEFVLDERWYVPDGRWGDLWPVPRSEGGFYAYIVAEGKGVVGLGVGESDDGLTWRTLPPAPIEGTAVAPGKGDQSAIEVSGVHEWGGRYYALLGMYDLGTLFNDKWEFDSFTPGETTVVADSPTGPFRPAPKNRRLLVGNNSYFVRFADTDEGVLVNHHSWEVDWSRTLGAGPTYLAPLKRADCDDEGTLRLAWWPGNDRAKGHSVPVTWGRSDSEAAPTFLDPAFDPDEVLILEGVVTLPSAADAPPTGFFVEGSGERGTAFLVRHDGVVEHGELHREGTGFAKEDQANRDLAPRTSARFRFVRTKRMTELYLDDYLMQTHSLAETGTGRVGLIGPAGAFRDLEAWYARP